MAKPNYQFEKRQRELEKKRKKEEKAQRKAQGHAEPSQEPDEGAPQDPAAPGDAEDQTPAA